MDGYVDANGTTSNNRDSTGAFGVGMGLLGEMSDDDSDEDDMISPPLSATALKGKNQALYDAMKAPAAGNSTTAALPPSNRQQPPSSAQTKPLDLRGGGAPNTRGPPQVGEDPFRDGPPGRRPPGLTIPPAAQTTAQLATSPQYPPTPHQQQMRQQQLAAPPQMINRTPSPSSSGPSYPRDIPSRAAAASPMPAPVPQRPAPAFMIAPPGSPAPSMHGNPNSPNAPPLSPMFPSTTPLQLPPSTPITPLFAAPPTPSTDEKGPKVSFAAIIRGEHESALLDRSKKSLEGSDQSHSTVGSGLRGKRVDGDDFWRRFSMVAHQQESDTRKVKGGESSWLAKTQSRTKSYSRWVALVGIFFLCLIVGGVFCGVWFSRGSGNGHAAPEAIGGKENQGDVTSATSTSAAVTNAGAKTSGGYARATMTTSNGVIVAMQKKRAGGDFEHATGVFASPSDDLFDDSPLAAPTSHPIPRTHHDRRQHRNRQFK